MKPVIGIISYLPDDSFVRQSRLGTLRALIQTCNNIFNLPIYIVIQNYTEDEEMYIKRYTNVTMSDNHGRLGIVGARKKLREWFIESEYDHLIMLDDDCILEGTSEDGQEYLKQLKENEGKFGEFNLTLLKLFSISKELLQQIEFIDINPEDGEGFEDRIFVETLRIKFPDKKFTYKTNIQEESISTNDNLSTWYNNQDLKQMLKNTQETIEKIKEDC